MSAAARVTLLGVDFTSSPSRRKPVTVAIGMPDDPAPDAPLRVRALVDCPDWASFDAVLARPGPWVGAFDFPFGLPRELVESLGWPTQWPALMALYAALPREAIRERFRAFCAARPAGGKFAHRATDGPARSSPSMKWVNPPVAFMLHAGVPRLLAAGASLPGLHEAGDPDRVALEGYPALVARACVGAASYKSDARGGATPARREARAAIVDSLARGAHGYDARPVVFDPGMAEALIDEPGADRLDAVLCLVLAAWAWSRRASGWGLPPGRDPLEGWIVGAGQACQTSGSTI